MIAALVAAAIAAGFAAGAIFGANVIGRRTAAALKRARYDDAIALADALVNTPDSLELRDRAQKILAAHRAANPTQEY